MLSDKCVVKCGKIYFDSFVFVVEEVLYMIEFKGHLSKKAKKYFFNIEKIQGTIMILCSFITVLPIWIIAFAKITELWILLTLYGCGMVICLLAIWLIPIDKKFIPKRIYADDGYITVVLENGVEEYKSIDDIKIVYDFGDFYAVKFYFGNKNNKFICQKDLISKGNVEDFETLFGDKIQRCKDTDTRWKIF